jgi:hypothetical protein
MGKLVGIHRNKTSNPFKVYNSSTDYLVVGGGGGAPASADPSGGGGAGGLIHRQSLSTVLKGVPLLITIGAGGATAHYGVFGNNGQNSVFDLEIAYGGGCGARSALPGNGGSGGGSCTIGVYGTGVTGQGYNGKGAAIGGGGGAGEPGGTDGDNFGGDGLSISITGSAIFYAGGGGGGGTGATNGSNGGTGGGGHGMTNSSGVANTGGGAGGNGNGSGGSGVVIVAYPNTMGQLLIDIGLSYTYSSSSRVGYHVYTFTAGTGYIGFR